ncbi:MAG: hypothetical protein GY757_17775 [bacterium]|nr:hypothetical protein [bacterium]
MRKFSLFVVAFWVSCVLLATPLLTVSQSVQPEGDPVTSEEEPPVQDAVEKEEDEPLDLSEEDEPKRLTFDLSFGFAGLNLDALYNRGSGTDALVNQYADAYQLSHSSSGKWLERKHMIPVGLSANYQLKEKIFLNVGFEYSSGSIFSQRSYNVKWDSLNEVQTYDHSYKITCFMPRVGVSYRYKSLDIYGAVGIGSTNLTHEQDYARADEGPSYSQTYSGHESFKVKGSGTAIIIGVKYNWKLDSIKLIRKLIKRSASFFVKAEYMMLTVKNLTGSKSYSFTMPDGEKTTGNDQGSLYSYDWDPYGNGSFQYWDLFPSAPDGADISNAEKLGLKLSGIRLMIGISF